VFQIHTCFILSEDGEPVYPEEEGEGICHHCNHSQGVCQFESPKTNIALNIINCNKDQRVDVVVKDQSGSVESAVSGN
jgi:hypothetical protein